MPPSAFLLSLPRMSFAAPSLPPSTPASSAGGSPALPHGSALPRLDRVLSDVARAALAARRRGARMSPETRQKIADTARRNRELRNSRALAAAAAAPSRVRDAESARPLEEEATRGERLEDGDRGRQGRRGGDGAATILQHVEKGTAGVGGARGGAEVEEEEGEVRGEQNGRRKKEVTAEKRAEVGQKISAALKGRKVSEERRRKISKALKGRSLSAEHRKKLSARFAGESNPMYGRKLSKESRAKISARRRQGARERKRAMEEAEGEAVPVQEKSGGEEIGEETEKPRNLAEQSLVDQAMRSRLVTSLTEEVLTEEEEREAAALDVLLRRVSEGEIPPIAVAKVQKAAAAKRAEAEAHAAALAEEAAFVSADEASGGAGGAVGRASLGDVSVGKRQSVSLRSKVRGKKRHETTQAACGMCDGSGKVECGRCVGQFGTASRHCADCHGAAVVFCPKCLGAGIVGD